MDDFSQLGAALEDGWRDADRDEERFPDVAALVLEESAPMRSFDRDRFIGAMLDPHAGGRQHLAPVGAFGQPGFTAFHGDGFVIEVYYWLDSMSAIHNHPFCGVFTVLEGWSVHARYKTSVGVRAGSRGQLMDVRLAELELVEAGCVERFSLRRHPLIHALIHIPVPTISMVIRTTRTDGYLRYLPPSLAIPMEAPTEPGARRMAMVESLVAAGDPAAADRLRQFLAGTDFETAVRLVSGLWPNLDPTDRPVLLESITGLHGDRVDAIEAAMNRSLRLQEASAIRSSLRDSDLRLCATALAYAESRHHVLRLLEKRPGDPITRLRAFADQLLDGDDEQATRLIAGTLIDGGSTEEALAALERTYGPQAVAEQRSEVQRYCTESIFSVLSEHPA